MAGDVETGVTIHRTVKDLDAGPIAAQRSFLLEADDDAADVYARAAELAVELLDEVLAAPAPAFRDQPSEGATYADKIAPEDRLLDLDRPPRELVDAVRALSPHIGARAELHGRPVTVWRAQVGDGRSVRASRGAACGRPSHGVRRVAPRAAVSPARRAAFDVLRRVFEDDAYADLAFPTAAKGLDERDRALAQRLAFGAVQRVRTLDFAIETLGRRPVRKLDAARACGAQARRVPARVRGRRSALRGGQRVGGARPSLPGSSVRSRSRTRCSAASPTASRRCSPVSRTTPRRPPGSRTPTRTGSRRSGGATSAPPPLSSSCARRTSLRTASCGSCAARSKDVRTS